MKSLNPFRAGRCLSTHNKRKHYHEKLSQSLSSRAMSFDCLLCPEYGRSRCLNPFRAGRCLSTGKSGYNKEDIEVSIPFEQGDVFRPSRRNNFLKDLASQSLSNRAMSFDTTKPCKLLHSKLRLNPFRTGRCLSTLVVSITHVGAPKSQSLSNRAMSFDAVARAENLDSDLRLNPFRTGRCLSTYDYSSNQWQYNVSIPFEQGDVFRQNSRNS